MDTGLQVHEETKGGCKGTKGDGGSLIFPLSGSRGFSPTRIRNTPSTDSVWRNCAVRPFGEQLRTKLWAKVLPWRTGLAIEGSAGLPAFDRHGGYERLIVKNELFTALCRLLVIYAVGTRIRRKPQADSKGRFP